MFITYVQNTIIVHGKNDIDKIEWILISRILSSVKDKPYLKITMTLIIGKMRLVSEESHGNSAYLLFGNKDLISGAESMGNN
jgi:hypothetical protein